FGERLHVVVDVLVVGADVLVIVVDFAELHALVMRGDVTQRVGQHPVVVRGAADGAAFRRKGGGAALGERATLFTHDTQLEHGSPNPGRIHPFTGPRHARGGKAAADSARTL